MNNASKDANRNLDEVIKAEARGDESNLKGTDYHIVYALWLLVVQRTGTIYFFAGNDLLAQPIHPPEELDENLSLNSPTADQDEWIQLKCVVKPWTPTAILDDNLVVNFIFNSYISEQNARKWVVKLVTTAAIRQDDITKFVESPNEHSLLLSKLDQVVDKAHKVLDESRPGDFTKQSIRERAFDILKQLATSEPIALDTLRAELNVELALYSRGDTETMSKLRKRLVGGLLEDSAKGSDRNQTYDGKWVEEIIGISLARRGTFSVTEVCQQQIHRQTPDGYINDHVAARKLTRILDEFANASATTFILAGRSGTGKTWSLFHWALQRNCTLFIPGYRLLSDELYSVVANEVRSDVLEGTDHEIFSDIVRASKARGTKLIIIIDDVMPTYSAARDSARIIAQAVLCAETHAVKLVVSSQLDVITSLRPFEFVPKSSVFQIDAHSPPTNDPSWIQGDLTTDEMQFATALRTDDAAKITATLSDPAISVIRNPYILDAVLSQIVSGREEFEAGEIGSLTELIELQVQKRLEQARQRCNLSIAQLRIVLSSVSLFLHEQPDSRMLDLFQYIERTHSVSATEALEAFVDTGILTEWERAVIPDQRIAARLIADQYLKESPTTTQLIEFLSGSQNNSLTVDILVSLEDPVSLAEELMHRNSNWISPVAEGLSLSSANEAKVECFLVALSRSVPPQDEVYRAMGRLALRSDLAHRELTSRFLERQTENSRIASRSLGCIVDINSSTVIELVRKKWELCASVKPVFPDHSKEYRAKRRSLADAIAPLKQIQSQFASQQVQKFLVSIEEIVEEPLRVSDQADRITYCFTDPLITEFAEVRMTIAAVIGGNQWHRLLDDLTATDLATRIPIVSGFASWANRNADQATDHTVSQLRTEQNFGLYATIAWCAINVARQQPRLVLDAIVENISTAWGSYETTCATIAMLDIVAESYPAEVLALLPPNIDGWPDFSYWLTQELVQCCLVKCTRRLSVAFRSAGLRSGPVDSMNELYQLRANFVGTVCSMANELRVDVFPQYWQTKYRHLGMDFFKVGIADWFRETLASRVDAKSKEDLINLIVKLTLSANQNQAEVLQQWVRDVRFWIEIDCLDVLISIAISKSDCISIVRQLPSDWQQLYAVSGILELGHSDGKLVDFAVTACEQKRNSASAQASHERTRCLKLLQQVVPDRIPSISEEKGHWFLGSSGPDRLLASLEENPFDAFATLANEIKFPSDILFLKGWESESRHWSTTLVARVYCRMLVKRPMTTIIAKQYCLWILEACKYSTRSQFTENQRLVYTAILEHLNKQNQLDLPTLATLTGPVAESEVIALQVLGMHNCNRDGIRRLFVEYKGWWHAHDRKWEETGELSSTTGFGESYYVVGFYPAVRLALIAVGDQLGAEDFGFEWMEERSFGELLAKKLENRLRWGGKLNEIDSAIEMYPEHERLHGVLGHSLLKRGNTQKAKQVLHTALLLPFCQGVERASVFYNLACAHALLGEIRECRECLWQSARLNQIDLNWLAQDTDFDGVRNQRWFWWFVRRETWRIWWLTRKRKSSSWLKESWKRYRSREGTGTTHQS
jgi:hypothetical protein